MLSAIALLVVALGAGWLWTPDLDRATLESRYLAAPGDMRDVAGARLHVRDSGPRDAPAVLLLHGFGASLHTWEPWAQALQGDFRVVRFDLPGSGLSLPDPQGDYRDARSLAVLGALLDQLGIAQAAIVGNSMGGRIAWEFAARQPERVSALVLVSPDGFASPGFEYGKQLATPAFLQLMRWALPQALLRMSLEPAYANPAVMTDALAARYHDLLRAPGAREAMLQRMGQIVLEDPVPWLKKIDAPTLLMWGEQDAMIPFRHASDYVNALHEAQLVALPGIGHLPQEEDPARSVLPVQAFLHAHLRTAR